MKWQLVDSIEILEKYIKVFELAKVIAIDTETTGLNPFTSRLRLIQIAMDNQDVLIIDCFKVLPEASKYLQKIMNSNSVKVFQNAKFDIKFLKANGIEVSGKLFDTMIAGQLLRSSGGIKKVSLDNLAKHYLGEEISKIEQLSDFSNDLTTSQLEYAAMDSEILLRLRRKMIEKLKENNLIEVARLEFECVYAIASIEYSGIFLDKDKWIKLTETVEREKENTLEKLYPYIGYPIVQLGLFESVESNAVNLNSNKQVLQLFKEHGLDLNDTSRHTLSQHLEHPIVKLLLDYRSATKALSLFLYNIPKQINNVTNRLHPSYGQNGAYSGRMSCGGPNIQQIPREERFRSCFVAPKGRKLIIADYSQIELRVMAEFTQDKRMLEAYNSGEDLHKLTASLVLDKDITDITKSERQAAKAVNFGLIFGMGAAGLKAYAAETYHTKMSIKEAELFKKRYFEAYKGVDRWQKNIRKALPTEARTLAGRKFLFKKESGMSGRYNTPIQGTAADILKNALGSLNNVLIGKKTQIVAVVHDEIVLECPVENAESIAKLLTQTMEDAGGRYIRSIPVIAEASIADSWAGK